jgi:hypothetical protein
LRQDTGSAIVGPARADLYLGAGDDAARIAGRIRHPGRFVMLLPRELDMIAAGKQMPLPVPKPNLPELAGANEHEQGNVASADEDWRRQAWTRKPAPRDCATRSSIGCGNKSVPVLSKQLSTTGQGPAGVNKKQLQQQHAQSGMQGRGPDQLRQQGIQGRGPQQKQEMQTKVGREPQRRQQQSAIERRGPQQKQQPPATEGRGPKQKQQPQATERRLRQQKEPPPATEGRGG